MDFEEIKIVNELGLRYSGLESGDGDVGVGFTTDGQLASDELVVMKDPKNIWPFYYPAPVVRSDVLKKYPKVEEVLNEVSASLDAETMRELNGQVDLDQEDPEDVAAEYLEEQGIVKNKANARSHTTFLEPLRSLAAAAPWFYAERSPLPMRGNGAVEKITSTGTSKYSAIFSARYRLGLYSPLSR